MTKSIGFLGLGEIAEAMILGLGFDSNAAEPTRVPNVWVSRRNEQRSAKLSQRFPNVQVAENQQVIDHSDILVLAMMSSTAEKELPGLTFSKDQIVISVMVDVSLERLKQLCAPASDISITIPLPFISQGNCPLPVYPDTGSVAELFGAQNPILPMDSESALNAHFGATAMASVVLDQMRSASNWLSDHTDDRKAAEIYMVTMLAGYLASLPTDGDSQIQAALSSLSTEGGLNATLKQHMLDSGTLDRLMAGLHSFNDRLGLQ